MNYYATLTLVGLLASVGFALAAPTDPEIPCLVTRMQPTFNVSKLEAINSNDSVLLAKMGAYFEMSGHSAGMYLWLEFEEVSIVQSEGSRPSVYTFKADCATFTFTAPRDKPSDLEVYFPNPESHKPLTVSCNGVQRDGYMLPLGHHKCSPLAYDCWGEDLHIATLYIVNLEYEASADKDMHKNKKFAGPPSSC